MTRTLLPLAALAALLVLAPAAAGVGPSLPATAGPLVAGETSYVTSVGGSSTVLSRRVEGADARSVTLPGTWGIPMVTLNGGSLGGLSPNGRILVLSDNVDAGGTLRDRSAFAVVDTRRLALVRTISLRGDYSFDALSPSARWLYLIHHITGGGSNRYQVRAYDLRAGKLLPGVIADKRQAGWLMSGYPVSRATTASGRWVYTLYQQNDNYPFIHALDTVSRTAICIGLPWKWWVDREAIGGASLTLAGRKLDIQGQGTSFALDTTTFRVTKR